MTQAKILIVEDDMDLADALSDTLRSADYDVIKANDGRMALELVESHLPEMLITDIQLPRMDGHNLLKNVKKRWPDLPVLMMTAYGSIEMAVEAMRDGAVDYLTKPFEAEVLISAVSRYMDCLVPREQDYIAVDKSSRDLLETLNRVARSDATVLINGESGVGKEVVARYIHTASNRDSKPFIAINCAAIPDNMLEATLFGYEKGAFTGAYKACPGKFEFAEGGTLLLDEISEMDLALQAKLLRVLQEREVERLGGNQLIQLDVRVLATSNRNMREEVKAGKFREDLFYRLNVFPVHVNALRHRKFDIIPLAKNFIRKHFYMDHSAIGEIPLLSEQAETKLLDYHWPGNVRELDNVIQRALIMRQAENIVEQDIEFEQEINFAATNTIEARELVDADSSLEDEVKYHEHNKILKALEKEMGNRKLVAEKLGISERTLRYKLARMRKAGIKIPNRYRAAVN